MKIFFSKYKNDFGENDFSFLNRVYSGSLKVYEARLRAIGFEGMDNVLDAGCGFGQWAMVLSQLNRNVFACDISEKRVKVCTEIADYFKRDNVQFKQGSLEALPYPSSYFDGLFCFGAIYIANPRNALKEFYRVLKPGGKLYTNANGLGWTINLWLNSPNRTKDYDPRVNVVKAFQNTINFSMGLPKGDAQIIVEKEEMLRMLKKTGFKKIVLKDEGKINVSKNNKVKPKPFFKGSYYGFTGVYELLAKK